MPVKHYESGHSDKVMLWTICMEGLGKDLLKPNSELACSSNHVFHSECLEKWLELKNHCPKCNQKIY